MKNLRENNWIATLAAAVFAVSCGLGLAGCEDSNNPLEDAGDSIEDAADDTQDAVEDAADDTGDAIEDATN